MKNTRSNNNAFLLYLLAIVVLSFSVSCNSTKHLADNQYMLQNNTLQLFADKTIHNKGELKDNLNKLIIQKPNDKILGVPYKVLHYNFRYKKFKDKKDDSLSKSVERPVVFDTAAITKTIQNIKGYLFNQSFYYAKIKDTFIIKGRKAYVKYKVYPGDNYLINKEFIDVDDSSLKKLIVEKSDESPLYKDRDFSNSLVEEERGRVTAIARNNGYYSFSQDNVAFKLDTIDNSFFKNLGSPFESAVNAITYSREHKKPLLDVDLIVRRTDDTTDYIKYKIGSITIYPDYDYSANMDDSVLTKKIRDSITYKYRYYYIKENVLDDRIFLRPGSLFSQADLDKTRAKLNELGIFQFIRIEWHINDNDPDVLDLVITMNRLKRFDFGTNYALSSGSTYSLGHQVSLSYRNKNLAKGADLWTVSANGGVEYAYDENQGKTVFDHFSLLTEYYGINTSIDFPKFLAPINPGIFDNSSLPHTVISGGINVMDRVNYFTLINNSINFSYKWYKSKTITWNLSPIFVNVIQLPVETDSFIDVLSRNAYLKNSYKPNFIEGENLSFTFSDADKKHGKNYTYLKLSIEEAGAVLGVLNDFGAALNDLYDIKYAQYSKFDFDVRHYFTRKKSMFATRFDGGIGLPYGNSLTLPYIKQYFAGGPYDLRGWRIRSLGPGSYYNAADQLNPTAIDLTGDVKLEMNAEYRFPIAPLFAGAMKMNGALFVDAGNIWLAKADTSFSGGEFRLSTLTQDIAMDAGAGLRFDIAFITLRTDVAFILKKPYDPENDGWVLNQINPYDTKWRENNIIFNISIGYPF